MNVSAIKYEIKHGFINKDKHDKLSLNIVMLSVTILLSVFDLFYLFKLWLSLHTKKPKLLI